MEESTRFLYSCSEQKIQQWLKEVFQKENIPSFDETPEFTEALNKIMNENVAAEKNAKSIIKAEKNIKDFYNEKGEELQLVTDFLQLNSETYRRVQGLASVVEKLKLKEPSYTHILLAMSEIEDKELEKAEKEFITSHHMSVFSKKVKNTMKMNEKLRRYLKSLAKVVEIQKSHNSEIMKDIIYFEEKKGDLENRIRKSNESLLNTNYLGNKDIRHSALVEKAQKLKGLEEHLKVLENKIEAYHSLNPHLAFAEAAVGEKENELRRLEEDLQKLLRAFETS